MSYFVIKGPRDASQYLCIIADYDCPQWWHERSKAARFPDEESAWKWLEAVQVKHGTSGSYTGRVVRVNTPRDWRAERVRLLAEIERLRTLREAPR